MSSPISAVHQGRIEGGKVRSRLLSARPSMHLRTGPSLTAGGKRGDKLGVDKGLSGVLASDHACGGRVRIGRRRCFAAAAKSAEWRSARTHEEDKGVDDHEEAVAELDHACDAAGTVSRRTVRLYGLVGVKCKFLMVAGGASAALPASARVRNWGAQLP